MWAADAAAGKAVYTSKCQTCHAADGSGNPGLGKALGVTWVPLGSVDVQKMSDDDLKKVATAGKGKMKPVASVVGGDLTMLSRTFARSKSDLATDVLHPWHVEQTECFMFLWKSLINGPSSNSSKRRKGLKTEDATHPLVTVGELYFAKPYGPITSDSFVKFPRCSRSR